MDNAFEAVEKIPEAFIEVTAQKKRTLLLLLLLLLIHAELLRHMILIIFQYPIKKIPQNTVMV